MRSKGARKFRVCERYGIDAEATWTPVPHALRKLAKERGLGLAAYVVLIEVLDAYQPVFGGVLPFSAKAVERLLPMTRRHAGAAIDELERSGLVRVDRPKGGRMLLHVGPLLLALRVECSKFRRTGHLPLMRHETGGGSRLPRGVAASCQGGGARLPPAGSVDVPDQPQDARAIGERAHIAEILAQLKLPKRKAN